MLSKEEQLIFYQKVGERIRSFRKNEKIKQEVLAQRLGLTRISVVNIEHGKQKVQLHVLIEICDALGVQLHQIVPTIEFLGESQDRAKLQKDVEKKLEKFDVQEGASEIVTDFLRLTKSKF